MRKRCLLLGAAIAGLVVLAAAPASTNEEPGGCYVVIPARPVTNPVPDEAGREPSFCFDTREQLYEAERQAGLRD